MALGGGTFISQNKVLPGGYINFVSVAHATANLSDRGVAAMALELDWGVDSDVFTVSGEDFEKRSMEIFGYEYTDEKLKGLRDLFKNIRTLYAYKLNGNCIKASADYATARYGGTRGNDIRIVVSVNADDNSKYDVKTFFDKALVDMQVVGGINELVDNSYVCWNRNASLDVTVGMSFSGGTNGDEITAASHQSFLNLIESYSFNTIGVVSENAQIAAMYGSFCKRMRDEIGMKFQCVVWNYAADYEGVINVKNGILDDGASKASLVYWVTGASAGCAVNASLLNKTYDGEYDVDIKFTQPQLEEAINSGEFALHKAGSVKRVLSDVNSLTTTTASVGAEFKENQTVRIIDQIANDVAALFNEKYLGVVPNDEAGRISLWNDIVKHHSELQKIRAIEDFMPEDVVVSAGDSKKSVVVVDKITPVNAMMQLYMTVYIN